MQRTINTLQEFSEFITTTAHHSPDEHNSCTPHAPNAERESAEIFSQIYRDGLWGRSPVARDEFFSGAGSHDPAVVGSYVSAVTKFLCELTNSTTAKPNIADLGCGDFTVGAQLRGLCGTYIACDVVPRLIARNREQYGDLSVDFVCLDITRHRLPGGDVAFVRQVFQHLSNEQISRALPDLTTRYKYVILTEHLPARAFTANLDKPTGHNIRLDRRSGVVLTDPPFNVRPLDASRLCAVHGYGGIIATDLYRFS